MDIEEILQSHELRMTKPRQLVWDVLTARHSHDNHLTAAEVAEHVHMVDETVNVSSVYRALSLFDELGLVRESRLGGDDVSRWEPSHDDDTIHLVCESCGAVQHHHGDAVDRLTTHLSGHHGFVASSVDIVVKGTCESCSA